MMTILRFGLGLGGVIGCCHVKWGHSKVTYKDSEDSENSENLEDASNQWVMRKSKTMHPVPVFSPVSRLFIIHPKLSFSPKMDLEHYELELET